MVPSVFLDFRQVAIDSSYLALLLSVKKLPSASEPLKCSPRFASLWLWAL